jgi:ATP-binding protein involved in chromosome partitioning
VPSPDGTPLTATGKLSDILVTDGKVFFSMTVDAAHVQQWESVRERAQAAVRAVPGVESVMIALTAERGGGHAPHAPSQPSPASGGGKSESGAASPRTAPPRRPMAAGGRPGEGAPHAHGPAHGPAGIPGVAAIIADASGKGGVGKSTVAINLALALHDLGLKVGVLDADIYGPSLPKLLAIRERPEVISGTRLRPIVRHGMPVMSIGFLVEEETPMIWRGPMVMSALTQMLREVEWGTLDVMVVVLLPPGTGDAQPAPAVLKARRQSLDPAGRLAHRAARFAWRRVGVPVLGIVECDLHRRNAARARIFSARRRAGRAGGSRAVPRRSAIEIREKSDAGAPVVASAPAGVHARHFRDIAARVRDGLGVASRPAPKIVIEA